MSLWKFGNFEAEVNFSDADFLDKVEEAKRQLGEAEKRIPATGKSRDIILSEVAASDAFFDTLFGEGAGYAIRDGRNSIKVCIGAMEALNVAEVEDSKEIKQTREKYMVQNHGNRQQRKAYQKNNKNQHKGKQR